MSHTYALACHDCRVGLWIGQGWARKGITLEEMHREPAQAKIYTTQEYLDHLRDFLYGHMGHALVFDRSDAEPIWEYADVVPLEDC